MTIILGLALLLAPALLLLLFEDKLEGVLWVLPGTVGFHLAAALLTQALHRFSYGSVTALCCAGAAACVAAVLYRRKRLFWRARPDVFAAFALLLAGYQLWSVHYRYTGPVATIAGVERVEGRAYRYPTFSDEWAGVALADYSLRTGSLPSVNPLNEDMRVVNPLLPFFSLTAELLLLLGLQPLTSYALLAVAAGLAVCLMLYALCRAHGLSPFAGGVAVLAAPYIVNGANLPGLWYFLPVTAGLLLLLCALSAFRLGLRPAGWLSLALSAALYPPGAVFLAPAAASVLASAGPARRQDLAKAGAAGALALLAVTVPLMGRYPPAYVLSICFSRLFRDNLVRGIPSFAPWNVVPVVFLAAIAFGLVEAARRKERLVPLCLGVGGAFWLAYTATTRVLVIDYPRVVFITSVLAMVPLAFAVERGAARVPARAGKALAAAVFLAGAAFYPRWNAWQALTLEVPGPSGPSKIAPLPPMNAYLTDDDLRLFGDIHEKRFIAPAWKGLTIGAATHNFPLDSKPSTLTVAVVPYGSFAAADCALKSLYAKRFRIDYAYAKPFSCDEFEAAGAGGEGLALYRYAPK